MSDEALRRIEESMATGKPAGEIKGLATSGLASAGLGKMTEYQERKADALIRRLDKGEGVVMPPEDSDLVGERLKTRDVVKPEEIRELLAEAKEQSKRGEPGRQAGGAFVDSAAGVPPDTEVMRDENGIPYHPFVLKKRHDAPPLGAELDSYASFRAAARSLKAAELAYRDAQQVYAEAVKVMSEEAVK